MTSIPSFLYKYFLFFILLIAFASSGCNSAHDPTINPLHPPGGNTSPESLGIVGDEGDVNTLTKGGTVLMGGGTDVDEAMKWMIERSGGGDFVVIRATGTDANRYIYGLGSLNSVETLLINSKKLANSSDVENKIRNAEALFIAGGDQADYYTYWKDTKVEEAINYLIHTKKVPVGGTSAGCAIQGKIYFSASKGTITSGAALANPYDDNLTLEKNNFIDNGFLLNTITDTHFNNPDRRGRLISFMARIATDWSLHPRGIGIDEKTAVCIDEEGKAKVFGSGTASFFEQTSDEGVPERCQSGVSLDWNQDKKAVTVYSVNGTALGTNTFDLNTWKGSGGIDQYFYVKDGVLLIN